MFLRVLGDSGVVGGGGCSGPEGEFIFVGGDAGGLEVVDVYAVDWLFVAWAAAVHYKLLFNY